MSDLLYEVKDKVATITLNRPDKLNAFTADMIQAWAGALAEAQADDGVNVVIVTGAGRAFFVPAATWAACGRATDRARRQEQPLGRGAPVPKQLKERHGQAGHRHGQRAGRRGGAGMCVMCDMRVAAESARFSTGYVVGAIPGDGDTYFAPPAGRRGQGPRAAVDGGLHRGPGSHRLGIVQRVVPDDKLRDETYALARQIADGPRFPFA